MNLSIIEVMGSLMEVFNQRLGMIEDILEVVIGVPTFFLGGLIVVD
jgi:hypothetical protein